MDRRNHGARGMTGRNGQTGQSLEPRRNLQRLGGRSSKGRFGANRRTLSAICLLAVSAWCLAPDTPWSPSGNHSITVRSSTGNTATVGSERRTPPAATRQIESIRVGSRVLAANPEISTKARVARPEPDWRDWVWISLELPLPDFATDRDEETTKGSTPTNEIPPIVHVDLLRPEGWARDRLRLVMIDLIVPPRTDHHQHRSINPDANHEARSQGPLRPIYHELGVAVDFASARARSCLGCVIDLDLPEMGVAGPAWVTALRPCPQILPGTGEVVTGTFRHPATGIVLDVWFEGETHPIGVTANHLFWNAERGVFMPIGEMMPGQKVRTFAGQTKRVLQILPRPGPQVVYNLEVYAEHVYHVGQQGLLAHNSYASGKANRTSSQIPESYMNPLLYVNMEAARGLPGSTLNSVGEIRNANWFWKQLINRKPEIFSRGNLFRVENLGLSPRVDQTWVKNNPTHMSFLRDTLHHHHVNRGSIAVPLPESVHIKWTAILHGRQ